MIATNEMQNVMWAMLSWANEPRAVEQGDEEEQQRQAHHDLGRDHRQEQERLGRPAAAEPEPGQAEAEQRPEDRRHDHRDEPDLDRHADRREQVVVGQQACRTTRW